MSTLIEIQDAVAQLSSNERKALQLWLNSQTEPEMTAQEEHSDRYRMLEATVEQLHQRIRSISRVVNSQGGTAARVRWLRQVSGIDGPWRTVRSRQWAIVPSRNFWRGDRFRREHPPFDRSVGIADLADTKKGSTSPVPSAARTSTPQPSARNSNP